MPSKTRSLTLPLGTSLGLSLSLILILVFLVQGIGAHDLTHQVGWPVLRIIFFVALGLAAGEIIEATGWTRSLSIVARPLFSFARLGQRCSATFTAAFVSGVAANGMLVSFYEQGLIDKKRLFLTNFINQLPAFFLHLPTTLFVILPLAGTPGAVYLLLLFLAAVLRTGMCALYGRLRLSPPDEDTEDSQETGRQNKTSAMDLPGLILRRVPRRLGRIVQFVVPIYILVFALHRLGCFDFIQTVMAGTAVSALIPIEALSMVVISFLADYTSGFATAGALASSGVLSDHQVVLALVLGNVIALPVRSLRHQLPRYLGIFSPRMGTQILVLGQGLRVVSLIVVGAGYMLLGFS
ncbi:MAG: hypothetical protein ACLFT5_09430 [Desulfovermiculus sp.]